jgi:hypothetical protein
MKKLIIVLVLFVVNLSLFAQDLPDFRIYESRDEAHQFPYYDIIEYDRSTIDTAMSRLFENHRKNLNDWSDYHGSINYSITKIVPVDGGFKYYFERDLIYYVGELDKQNGKQYTLYTWSFGYTGKEGSYFAVFYYYKTNGRITCRYLIDGHVSRSVLWGEFVCIEDSNRTTALVGWLDGGGELIIPKELGITYIDIDRAAIIDLDPTAFRNQNITSVVIPSTVRGIREGTFSNNKITSITVPSLLRNDCRRAFTGNPIESITITAQQIVWPERQGPRGGAEPQTFFEDYLDEFFYKNSAPGTYTWDGSNWSFEKAEIPGDFFGKDSKRSPGLYTWEDGGWSYQSGSRYIADYDYYFGDYRADGPLYRSLPEPGVYKWENNTWVYHKHGE